MSEPLIWNDRKVEVDRGRVKLSRKDRHEDFDSAGIRDGFEAAWWVPGTDDKFDLVKKAYIHLGDLIVECEGGRIWCLIGDSRVGTWRARELVSV